MIKTKIKLFVTALMLAAAYETQAQTVMVVEPKSGGEVSKLQLSEVRKIEFGDNQLGVVARDGGEGLSMPLSDIKVIKFESVASSVSGLPQSSSGLRLTYDGTSLSALGIDGTARAVLYGIGGIVVRSYRHWDGQPICTAELPEGVYIFKVNDKSIKFVK